MISIILKLIVIWLLFNLGAIVINGGVKECHKLFKGQEIQEGIAIWTYGVTLITLALMGMSINCLNKLDWNMVWQTMF